MFCDLLTILAFERHHQDVSVHFSCFVWVSDASEVRPERDSAECFPALVALGCVFRSGAIMCL